MSSFFNSLKQGVMNLGSKIGAGVKAIGEKVPLIRQIAGKVAEYAPEVSRIAGEFSPALAGVVDVIGKGAGYVSSAIDTGKVGNVLEKAKGVAQTLSSL
jgi:hypothetical protein